MHNKNIDDLIRQTSDFFRSNAAKVAAELGCEVQDLVLDVTYRSPTFVPDKGYAAERAEDLSRSIALANGRGFGAQEFRVVENGSCKGLVGFASDGTPKVCVVKGVNLATCESGVLGYMSVAFLYTLCPKGSGPAAPHKPSDSYKRFIQS